MPPRRFKKKSVKRIVEKRVAKAIEEYEKTRTDSNNAGGSGSANTGGTVAPEIHGCSYKTFTNGKPHSFNGTEGVVGLKRWFEKMEQVFEICKCAEDDKVKFAMCTFEGRALGIKPLIALLMVNANALNRSIEFDNPVRGNGYPRKGQNSKPKRQNQARERKDREKSKRQSQSQQKSKSQSQPREVALEKASKTKPENLNCQKWTHPYLPSGPGMEHEGKNPNFRLNKASPSSIFMYPEINVSNKAGGQIMALSFRLDLLELTSGSVGLLITDVLDLPCLLVLITGTSQSRQHVDTSLIHIESLASPPTAVQFDETLEGFHSSL
ncbi:hypothetical protein Tco_1577258 [Tanacetum coccineum]